MRNTKKKKNAEQLSFILIYYLPGIIFLLGWGLREKRWREAEEEEKGGGGGEGGTIGLWRQLAREKARCRRQDKQCREGV